jgi:hypothetical protein
MSMEIFQYDFRYKIELPENEPSLPYEYCQREFYDGKRLYRTNIYWYEDGMTLEEVTMYINENYPDIDTEE